MMKIKRKETDKQKKALECMKQIAKCRDKLQDMGYMRKLKTEEPGKKIFSEYIEGYICDTLNLKRAKKINQKVYDARHRQTGKKFQIKETTLSAATVGDKPRFDYLVTVKLNKEDFSIREIGIFPKYIVKKNLGKKKDFRFKKSLKKYIYFENEEWKKNVVKWPL